MIMHNAAQLHNPIELMTKLDFDSSVHDLLQLVFTVFKKGGIQPAKSGRPYVNQFIHKLPVI